MQGIALSTLVCGTFISMWRESSHFAFTLLFFLSSNRPVKAKKTSAMVLDEEEEIVNSAVDTELNLDMKDGKMSTEHVLIVRWDDFVLCTE